MISRFFWVFFWRFVLRRKIEFFSAHWTSFVNRKTTFEGFNKIAPRCVISDSNVGRFTYFGPRTRVVRAEIGRFCSIGPDVQIGGLGTHPTDRLSTHPAFYSNQMQANFSFVENSTFKEVDSVYVGNDVWIGARVLIVDGVHIGDGAIVAAGAVVTKNVEAYTIVGGVPAKVIKRRESKSGISSEDEEKWWNLSVDELKKMVDQGVFQ